MPASFNQSELTLLKIDMRRQIATADYPMSKRYDSPSAALKTAASQALALVDFAESLMIENEKIKGRLAVFESAEAALRENSEAPSTSVTVISEDGSSLVILRQAEFARLTNRDQLWNVVLKTAVQTAQPTN